MSLPAMWSFASLYLFPPQSMLFDLSPSLPASGLAKIRVTAKEAGVEPAPQAGPVSVPGCRWMEPGSGQPLALSCPVTLGSCLTALGLFSFF
jgi:hypothetical protein